MINKVNIQDYNEDTGDEESETLCERAGHLFYIMVNKRSLHALYCSNGFGCLL